MTIEQLYEQQKYFIINSLNPHKPGDVIKGGSIAASPEVSSFINKCIFKIIRPSTNQKYFVEAALLENKNPIARYDYYYEVEVITN